VALAIIAFILVWRTCVRRQPVVDESAADAFMERKMVQPSPSTAKFNLVDESGVAAGTISFNGSNVATPNSTVSFQHSQNQLLNQQYASGSETSASRPFSSSTALSDTRSEYSAGEPNSAQPLMGQSFASQQEAGPISAVPSSPTEYQYAPRAFTQMSPSAPVPEKFRRTVPSSPTSGIPGPSLDSAIAAAYGSHLGSGSATMVPTNLPTGQQHAPDTAVDAFTAQRPSADSWNPPSKLARAQAEQQQAVAPVPSMSPPQPGGFMDEHPESPIDAPPVYSPH